MVDDYVAELNLLFESKNYVAVRDFIESKQIPFEEGRDILYKFSEYFKSEGRMPKYEECLGLYHDEVSYKNFFKIKNLNDFDNPLVDSYYANFKQLLDFELEAQKDEFNQLFRKSFVHLENNGYSFNGLKYKGIYPYTEDVFSSEKLYKIKFILDNHYGEKINNFKQNASVFIFINLNDVDFEKEIFSLVAKPIKGEILNINEDFIEILLNENNLKQLKYRKKEYEKSSGKEVVYSLVRWVDEVTYNIQTNALHKFFYGAISNPNLRSVLIGNAMPNISRNKTNIQKYFLDLNDDQKECVNKSFCNDDIFLVHGPPGTGKTNVCSEIIAQQILLNPESKILVCADSNQAVDNILEKTSKLLPLESHFSLLRVGFSGKIKESNKKFMLHNKLIEHPLQFFISQLKNSTHEYFSENSILTKEEFEGIKIIEKYLISPELCRYIAGYVMTGLTIPESDLDSFFHVPFSGEKELISKFRQFILRFGYNIIELAEPFINESKSERICLYLERLNPDTLGKIVSEDIQKRLILYFIEFSKDGGERSLTDLIKEHKRLHKKLRNHVVEGEKHEVRLDYLKKEIDLKERKKAPIDNQIIEIRKQIMYEIFSNASIIFCTNTTSGKSLVKNALKIKDFDLVVIDEATQAILPSTLIPLIKAKKVILAGDHKQLPPVVISQKAKDLQNTLFEKLIKEFSAYSIASIHRLKIQYRMHDSIIGFINIHYYDGWLESHQSRKVNNLSIFSDKPLTFLNLPSQESKLNNSRVNRKEVEIIIKIIEKIMVNNKIPQKDIGIITPYSEQVKLIKNNIKKYGEIDVKTVDGFQGGEKKIIILSLVRASPNTNSSNPIGFLNDMRRLNVSITRFEEKLIIVGDEKTFSAIEFDSNGDKIYFKDLFEYIKNSNFGEVIEGESKIFDYIENFKILISDGHNFEKKNFYSKDYSYLLSILKDKIAPKYKAQFIIDKSMINNNVFTKKYFDLNYDLGEKVKINLLDAITNILAPNSDNDDGKWKYFDSEDKRKEILLESITENGEKTVLQTLKLAYDLVPTENPVKNALRDDIKGLQVKNETKINLNPPIDSKVITPEIVSINQQEITKLFDGFITQPNDGEANFIKIHNAIFENINKEVLLVDIQVRPIGIKNLSKHLKLISKTIDVGILTSVQALIDYGKKNIFSEYVSEVRAISKLTNKKIIVRFFMDGKEEHDRYAIIDKNSLITLGPGLNIITSKKGTITPLPLNEGNIKQRDYYINYFNTALDLDLDESSISDLVNKKIQSEVYKVR